MEPLTKPFFSIIIPTCNSGKSLYTTLKSIAIQTFENVEVLIVDNHSADDTIEIAESFKSSLKALRIVSERDQGIYDAMNKGIDMSNGRWINFLGSDDSFFNKNVLFEVYKKVTSEQLDVLYGNVESPMFAKKYDEEFSTKKIINKNICHQAIFFNQKTFRKIGNFRLKYKVLADWDHNIRWFFSNNIKNAYFDITIANYGQGGYSSQHVDYLFLKDKPLILLQFGLSKLSKNEVVSFLKILFRRYIKEAYNFKLLYKIVECFFLFGFVFLKKRVKNWIRFQKYLFKNHFPRIYYSFLFFNKRGIEIGGPSNVFHDKLPVYLLAKKIDGVNYNNYTIWEGNLSDEGVYSYFKGKIGKQFVREAQNLEKIPNENYDFIVSSHCLEHCANPIAVIQEWKRVLRTNGVILILVPNKEYTFDHRRKVARFEHLLEDYRNKTGEGDLTHLEEIMELHDLEMDKPAGTLEALKERSLKNVENRCLHHHVFDLVLLEKIFDFHNLDIIKSWSFGELHHGIIGRKI